LSKIPASSLAIISNKAVIAINQDSLGKAAGYFQPAGAPAPQSGQLYQYWAGPLSDGYVIGLVASQGAATLSASFSDVPGLGAGTYSWTELYTGATGSSSSVSATLAAHDMVSELLHFVCFPNKVVDRISRQSSMLKLAVIIRPQHPQQGQLLPY
jgi:alpha-galactosidase